MKILIYNYKENFTLIDENRALFVLNFEMPNIEEEALKIGQLDYEGYAYTILKDNDDLYSSGIYTADSILDDLIEGPKYNK